MPDELQVTVTADPNLSTETADAIQELARRAAEWVASPEGQAAMAESLRRAEEATKRLTEVRKIDWRDLHKPCTI